MIVSCNAIGLVIAECVGPIRQRARVHMLVSACAFVSARAAGIHNICVRRACEANAVILNRFVLPTETARGNEIFNSVPACSHNRIEEEIDVVIFALSA